jgi:hypothetical protein
MTFSSSFYCIENETTKMKKALKNQGFSATAFAGLVL